MDGGISPMIERGRGLVEAGQLAEAMDVLQAATRMAPDDADAWLGLGIVCQRLHRFQEGLRALHRAVRLRPRDPHPHLYLGHMYERAGRRIEADLCYEAAERIDGVPFEVLAEIGSTYRARRASGDLRRIRARAERSFPGHPQLGRAFPEIAEERSLRMRREFERRVEERARWEHARRLMKEASGLLAQGEEGDSFWRGVALLEAAADIAPQPHRDQVQEVIRYQYDEWRRKGEPGWRKEWTHPPDRDPGAGTPRVLIVTDTADNREYLGELLAHVFNATVHLAADTASALAYLGDAVPDLVTTDLQRTTNEDGLELLHYIRSDPRLEHVPVVAITAAPGRAIEGISSHHFDHVIAQPVSSSRALIVRLERVLAGGLRRMKA